MTTCDAWTWDALWKAWQSFQLRTASEHALCCNNTSYTLESQSVDCVIIDAADRAFQHNF